MTSDCNGKSACANNIDLPSMANFGLTKKEFDRLARNIENGDESLFEFIYRSHFTNCIRYLRSFCELSEEDAYDIAMDTFLDFRNKIIEHKITFGNIRYLITKMAVHHYLDWFKKEKRDQQVNRTFVEMQKTHSKLEPPYKDQILKALNLCSLSHRRLIQELFYFNREGELIAREFKISYATLRKRKQRSLDKLRFYFLQLRDSQLG